ncbi:ATP-binding protein [Brachyspira aalborgi]|uniref:ATPase n=1 Tax=Brachyspira aalborgi TaxID=29522 RepID=A0A5C8CHJ5_9SPIR|nr:AAA family ATPase [Brachyspira aalborgi]TXJ12416.1 ATPase [Brachyspira aalborgi]
MILKLNNFGKFKNKSFEISNGITLFYGENESGKTTIFDSLMILFSESKRVSVFFKQMKSRYGNDIDIDFEPKILEHLKMHPQSYNNLYAIRQSEIIFEMSDSKKDSKDWESEIKKKLFSSDIDIGKMVSEIKAEYSSKAQNSILYKINILENEKIEIDKILNNLYDKINNSTNKKDNLKEFKENIFLHENILKEKIEEREKLYSLIKSKKEAETKSIKLNLLKQINDFNKSDEFLSKNIIYKDDYSKEINGRTKKIEDIKMNITFLKGKIEALKKSFVEEKNKTDYDSVKKRIENGINKIEDLTKKNNKAPKIIFLITVAFISSFLALYFKNPLFLTIIIPAIPFMFIKENKNSKIIKDILESLPELDIKETDIFIFKDLLNKELAKIEIIMTNNDNEEIENYNADLEESLKELENENNLLNQIFEKLKVKDKEEYYNIKNNYDLLLKQNEENYKKLMIEVKKLGLKNIETLEIDCIRILKELDEKGVNPNDYNEMEIKKIENNLKDLESEINILKEEINKIKNNISYIEGELNNSENIHADIINFESKLSQIKENIINLNKRRKALKLLEEMLFSINKKNDDIFQSLSKEARILYNHITGKNLSDDGIIMSGFDKDKIMVADKQNKIRNVEFLSSATRDAVYIAMRLSILTKIHQAGRLILLDDPFITFDNNRTKEALSFIKEYSKNYNIPVVIFTKDTFTRDFMAEYKDIIIYEL